MVIMIMDASICVEVLLRKLVDVERKTYTQSAWFPLAPLAAGDSEGSGGQSQAVIRWGRAQSGRKCPTPALLHTCAQPSTGRLEADVEHSRVRPHTDHLWSRD